jgi:hypothetical protein
MHRQPYTLSAADGRMQVTVFPGPPAYVYVTHDGLTEDDIDVALLELTWSIPTPCCVIVLPPHGVWWAWGPEGEGAKG